MAKGYHHVTRDIRSQIYVYKASGWSMQRMAKKLGVHVSTISREIRRNKGKQGYRIEQADRKARELRSAVSQAATKMKPDLIKQIKERIQAKSSPEEIAIRLKEKGISIRHESIYKMIWADKQGGGILYKHLQHHGERYDKMSSGNSGKGCVPGRVDISECPETVEEKSCIGDLGERVE